MTNVFDFLSSFFKTDGIESVDTHLGQTDIREIILRAELIGEKNQWLDAKNENVKIETFLVRFESSKRLVWLVYFLHTQKDWQISGKKTPWMRFAGVKIDDETNEVLFADFVKLQIVE